MRAELKELKAMHNDAQISKEAAQSELANQEKAVYHERKLREVELQKMKKEAEDKKMQHERIDRRIVRKLYQDKIVLPDSNVDCLKTYIKEMKKVMFIVVLLG